MRTGRPKQALVLSEEERERLQSLAHRARSQALLARRARPQVQQHVFAIDFTAITQIVPESFDITAPHRWTPSNHRLRRRPCGRLADREYDVGCARRDARAT